MKKNGSEDIQILPDRVPTVDSKKTLLGTVGFLFVGIVIYSIFIKNPESYSMAAFFRFQDILAILIIIETGILVLNLILRISRKKRRYQSYRKKREGKSVH